MKPEKPSEPLPPCPECQCKDFYKEKRFPKKIGLSIIAVAVVLSFWTYNISLIVAALIDALIYFFVPTQLVCYRCKHVIQNVDIPKSIKTYDMHTAELYNYGK